MKTIIAISAMTMLGAAISAFGPPLLPGDNHTAAKSALFASVSSLNIDAINSSPTEIFADSRHGSRETKDWLNPRPIHQDPVGQGRDPKPVPEPSTMLLLGAGLIGLAALTRRGIK